VVTSDFLRRHGPSGQSTKLLAVQAARIALPLVNFACLVFERPLYTRSRMIATEKYNTITLRKGPVETNQLTPELPSGIVA
jgi:hypothetical protein